MLTSLKICKLYSAKCELLKQYCCPISYRVLPELYSCPIGYWMLLELHIIGWVQITENFFTDDDTEVRGHCSYKVAKNFSYGNVTVDTLINKFGAMDEFFPWYLEEFLLAHSFSIPPSHNILFGVFKCLLVTLPQIPQVSDLMDLRDTIRTISPEPSQD